MLLLKMVGYQQCFLCHPFLKKQLLFHSIMAYGWLSLCHSVHNWLGAAARGYMWIISRLIMQVVTFVITIGAAMRVNPGVDFFISPHESG